MRRLNWLVGVLALVFIVGCGGEPIIGNWSAKAQGGPELLMNFQKDGAVALDLRAVEEQAKKQGATAAQLKQLRDQATQVKFNWKKEGSLYKVTVNPGAGTPPQDRFFRLDGKKLVPVEKDCKTVEGAQPLTRKE